MENLLTEAKLFKMHGEFDVAGTPHRLCHLPSWVILTGASSHNAVQFKNPRWRKWYFLALQTRLWREMMILSVAGVQTSLEADQYVVVFVSLWSCSCEQKLMIKVEIA